MKEKWLKYFTSFPHVYGVAVILDPQVKLKGLENLLIYYYYQILGFENYDVETYVTECRELVDSIYDYYYAKFNPNVDQSASASQPTIGTSYGSFLSQVIAGQASKKQKATTSSQSHTSSEFDRYLDTAFEIKSHEYVILEWWRGKEKDFPILSRIARDILAIPASSVASESAFSAGRRVLDEKRARLSPEMIEICVCKKDWDAAEDRTQGLRVDRAEEDDPLMLMDTETSGGADSFEEEDYMDD